MSPMRRHSFFISWAALVVVLSFVAQLSLSAPQSPFRIDDGGLAQAVADPFRFGGAAHTRLRRSLPDFMHPLKHQIGTRGSYFARPSSNNRPAIEDEDDDDEAAEVNNNEASPAIFASRPRRLNSRRTLPFNLVPAAQPGFQHSRAFVGDIGAGVGSLQSQYGGGRSIGGVGGMAGQEKVSPTELLSMLNQLTQNPESQKHRIRFGFF